MTSPSTTQTDFVTEVFDRKASSYADGYHGTSSAAHSFVTRRNRAYELIADRPPGRVLDVGCGPGVTVQDLATRHIEFHGVDISPAMIDECVRRFGHVPSARFSVGAVERLGYPDAYFDIVLAMGVVEYVDDDDAAIREMARVTRPGGVVIVTCPNRRSPYRIWQRTAYAWIRRLIRGMTARRTEREMVHREYVEHEYAARLAEHGLVPREVVYYNFQVLLFPLDRWFPRLTVATSRALERLGRGPLRTLGTGFIVKAVKS